MRLLNTSTLKVEEFLPDRIPRYAILSHTWEDGEVTFQDMENQTASAKAGWAKLVDSSKEALNNGFNYIWIDTCCIDKTSSAELSEAINAMFRWYKEAVVCYAFLADVPSHTTFEHGSLFASSKWFTRGWTLQELLAPGHLEFYSRDWSRLGSKSQLGEVISSVTGIDEKFLRGRPLSKASIAARMSWASKRRTTREEDRAYSLLGIFDIRLPLLYGEGGANAFFRLQEELIRTTEDQSIFAWHSAEAFVAEPSDGDLRGSRSWLAASPDDFLFCGNIVCCRKEHKASTFALSNAGVLMDMTILYNYEHAFAKRPSHGSGIDFVGLHPSKCRQTYVSLMCRKTTAYWDVLAIPVGIRGDKCVRIGSTLRSFDREWSSHRSIQRKLYLQTRQSLQATTRANDFTIGVMVLRSLPRGYTVDSVVPRECWEAWTPTSGRLLMTSAQVRASSFVVPVICVKGSDSLGEPQRKVYILVKPKLEDGSVKYVITISQTEVSGSLYMDRFRTYSAFVRTYISSLREYLRHPQIIRRQKYNLYLRMYFDRKFALGMNVVDLVADDSLWRDCKAYWSLYRGWEASMTSRRYAHLLVAQLSIFLNLSVLIVFYPVRLFVLVVSAQVAFSWTSRSRFWSAPLLLLSTSLLYSVDLLLPADHLRSLRPSDDADFPAGPVRFWLMLAPVLASLPTVVLADLGSLERVCHARCPSAFRLLLGLEALLRWDEGTGPDRMIDPTLDGRNL